MKLKFKIKDVVLSKWFPADDQFAAKMARLCILREDLMYELTCSINAYRSHKQRDYDQSWVMFYFFRKMFITVSEIRGAIELLAQDADFKNILMKQPTSIKSSFKDVKDNLQTTSDLIKEIRNTMSGHIKLSSLWDALQIMDYERHGILQISTEGPKDTHFKFTGELLMAVMFRNVPKDKKQLDEARKIADAFIKSIDKLFHHIDHLFFQYARDRKLL